MSSLSSSSWFCYYNYYCCAVSSSSYALGLVFIALVALIWAASSVAVQFLYKSDDLDFNSPFQLTYIGVSLFTVMLPAHCLVDLLRSSTARGDYRRPTGGGDDNDDDGVVDIPMTTRSSFELESGAADDAGGCCGAAAVGHARQLSSNGVPYQNLPTLNDDSESSSSDAVNNRQQQQQQQQQASRREQQAPVVVVSALDDDSDCEYDEGNGDDNGNDDDNGNSDCQERNSSHRRKSPTVLRRRQNSSSSDDDGSLDTTNMNGDADAESRDADGIFRTTTTTTRTNGEANNGTLNDTPRVNNNNNNIWTNEDHVRAALQIAPVWFVANWSYNASLAYTSITSSTVLASTGSLFTFLFAVLARDESFGWIKFSGVLAGVLGSTLTALNDAGQGGGGGGATQDAAAATPASAATAPLLGDCLGLLSAVGYGAYAVQTRLICPADESLYSMQLVLGYIGLVNMVVLSPVAIWQLVLDPSGTTQLSWIVFGFLVVKGLFDNVISDYLWLRAVVLTNATVATVGLGLTIPLAFLSDIFVMTGGEDDSNNNVLSFHSLVGALAVLGGFILVNVGQTGGSTGNGTGSSGSSEIYLDGVDTAEGEDDHNGIDRGGNGGSENTTGNNPYQRAAACKMHQRSPAPLPERGVVPRTSSNDSYSSSGAGGGGAAPPPGVVQQTLDGVPIPRCATKRSVD